MLLNDLLIESLLAQRVVTVEVLESIDSTNDYLKSVDMSGQKSMVCLAETQTKGHGQYGRQWYSPAQKNIYMSIRTVVQKPLVALTGLSLMVGISICQAIEVLYPSLKKDITLKWPNDIYLQGKKLGGVLIEVVQSDDKETDVIIGIGFNVLMESDDGSSDQAWVSLKQCIDEDLNRNVIAAQIINQTFSNINRFITNDFSGFHKDWNKKDFLSGKTIQVQSGHQTLKGLSMGVNDMGALILQDEAGQMQTIVSGKIEKIIDQTSQE
jgi:BirA family biotin operon repressor/biotin-[acetyl-CoA-carboxylase] ligase